MPSADAASATSGPASPSRSATATRALLIVLSILAGCSDILSFLRLDGLFTSHITGNLVILATHLVTGAPTKIAGMLAVPVFMVVVCLTALLGGRAEAHGWAPLRALLLVQFLFLAAFAGLTVAIGAQVHSETLHGIVAGMMGVAAMAVQNALVQTSFKGAPSTTVMTTNVARFGTDVAEVLLRRTAAAAAAARDRAARTLPQIIGFAGGGALGAASEALFGWASLVLPAGLGLLALGLGFMIDSDRVPQD